MITVEKLNGAVTLQVSGRSVTHTASFGAGYYASARWDVLPTIACRPPQQLTDSGEPADVDQN